MQDEDGYITLNIKPRKPALTTVDSASSSWRVMALILLGLSVGMLVGLVALGMMYVTQQNYLLTEKENLSETLQQLAKKTCQDLIKQSELMKQRSVEHKCSPCARKWRYYGDSCYGFFRHNLTWEESKLYCTEQNATLVKTASQKTLEYITDRISSIRWIGLSRQNANKVWTWEDGSVLSKNMLSESWDVSLYPTVGCISSRFDLSGNTGENTNCAFLHNGKIHSASCKDRHYLMCERKAGLANVDQLL